MPPVSAQIIQSDFAVLVSDGLWQGSKTRKAASEDRRLAQITLTIP